MRTKLIPLFFFFLLCLSANVSTAQESQERENTGEMILFNLGYGVQVPAADLSNRFGFNFNVGTSLEFMTKKKNYIFGLDGQFLFGNVVKEDPLAGIRSPSGFLIGIDKALAMVQLKERGFYLGAKVGKIFPLGAEGSRSGIRATLGAGILQHKIRIQDDSQTANQVFGPYIKGYDRQSNGLAFKEFIGYHLLSKNRQMNFFGGIEMMQAFTQSRRDFNFDTQEKDETKRVDLLFGLRVGLTLPFYIGEPSEQIYY